MKNPLTYLIYKSAMPDYLDEMIPNKYKWSAALNLSRLNECAVGDTITINNYVIEITGKSYKRILFWKIFKGVHLKITILKSQPNERKIHKTRR